MIAGLPLAHDIFLAPLSGISDVPFRRLSRRFGAALVYSEMVASGELLRGNLESRMRAMRDGSGVHAVQLAGRDPQTMGEAARLLADSGADLIDINFGCPAKKVVGGLSGSALMREPDLAVAIVAATVSGAGGVPVTVKMRLGWDRLSMNAADLAWCAQDAGVRAVTVHGRTRQQFYEGIADWDAIAAVKRAVAIPVIANGDLTDFAQLEPMRRRSGCDGLMVGRGACGRPWLPGFLGGALSIDDLDRIGLADLAEEHFEAMREHYGPIVGLRQARKHLGWYLDAASACTGLAATAMKGEVLPLQEAGAVRDRLRSLLAGLTAGDVERSRAVALPVAA